MIIERLSLHNFGVYSGKHEFDLAPPSVSKPVVLIGALNGAGKTTFLDAIRLAMHGKLADCSSRGSSSYEDFLRRSIHRHVDSKEGAAVEIQFQHTAGGRTHRYCVRRSWSVPSRAARERVVVLRDGEPDQLLTDSWQEHAETFLPSGIAPLFLFDGEQIERLADPEQSSQMLSTAVHALLGVDVVDQLAADLSVVERRKRSELEGDTTASDLASIETDLGELALRREDLVQERASLQTRADRAERNLGDAEARYRREGGELFQQRTELEAVVTSARKEVSEVEDQLRELLAQDLPLLLVEDLLGRVRKQDRRERTCAQAAQLCGVLEKRDATLLQVASSEGAPRQLLRALRRFLGEDRRKRIENTNLAPILLLSDRTSDALSALQGGGLVKTRERLRSLMDREAAAQARLTGAERKLATVPRQDAIAALEGDLDRARLDVIELEKERARLDALLEDAQRSLSRLEDRRLSILRRDIDMKFGLEDKHRVIQHSQRVRDTLARFRTTLLERNARRLANYVLESYQHLLRKQSLVNRIDIDPSTFAVSIIAPSGRKLRPERLSAGERQLLATAILWGLARATGRALPMVIDTPLGRLDSTHRARLVERYFPHASHQVILLSTDEEIDSRYLKMLKSRVGRLYRLEFNEESQSSSVNPGYFEEGTG